MSEFAYRYQHPRSDVTAAWGPGDSVNPSHYKAHPSGIEAITVTEHFNFCLGNVIKYVWRADQKGCALEDLKKALWYLEREIGRLQEKADGRKEEDR